MLTLKIWTPTMMREFIIHASISSTWWLRINRTGSLSLQNSRTLMSRSTESSSPISGPSLRSTFQSLLNVTQDWRLQIPDIPCCHQPKALVKQALSSPSTLVRLLVMQQRVIPLKTPLTLPYQRFLSTKNLNLPLLSSKTLHSMTTMNIGITS